MSPAIARIPRSVGAGDADIDPTAAAVRVAGCPDPKVIVVGNGEASLVFALGAGLAYGRAADAADFLAGDGCRAAIVARWAKPAFAARLAELGIAAAPPERVTGMFVATGRRADFGVYARMR